ncbi:MAG: hypothetical protein HYZ27_04815 [Deltaproteobacteria bacterium]|nr:hypothetical protein [Deltaproteobacteria bacterium]
MRIQHFVLAALLTMAACKTKSAEDEWRQIIASIPWLMEVLDNCETYKAAKREGDKRDIYTTALRLVRAAEVKDVRGEVESVVSIGDAKKPDEYSVQIQVRDKVRFASQSKDRPVKRGTKLFEQVAALRPGQCVVFSASSIVATSWDERGKVCTPHYYAMFSNITPCR